MRARMFFILFISSIIAFSIPAHAAPSKDLVLSSFHGTVKHTTATGKHPVPATANRQLIEGDALSISGAGYAEILVRDKSVIRIGDNGRLKILAIEPEAVHVFLETGKAYINFKGSNVRPLFLSTPSAEIDALGRSVFRIDIQSPSETDISVFSGQVAVAQPNGKMNISAGTRLIMRQDAKDPVMTTNRPADEWDKWNRERDGNKGETAQAQPVAASGGYSEPSAAGQQYVSIPAQPSGYPYYYYPSYYYYPYGYWPGPYYSYSFGWYGRPYYWRGGPYRGYWGPRPYYYRGHYGTYHGGYRGGYHGGYRAGSAPAGRRH